MRQGIFKWFSDSKGYGFIQCAEGDVFVHHSAILAEEQQTLVHGQHVTFEITEGLNGLQAKNVLVV